MRTLILWVFIGYCANYAYHHFNKPEVRLNTNGGPMIRLYTYPDCGAPCNSAEEFLQTRRVAFDLVDVEEDWDRYHELGGRNRFPTLMAGSDTVHGFEPGKFQAAMAATVGEGGVRSSEWRALQRNFDSSGAPKVVMYSSTTCGYCTKARQEMRSAGIEFTELFIDRDPSAKTDFNTLFGNGTPLIFKGYSRHQGYNRRLVDELG